MEILGNFLILNEWWEPWRQSCPKRLEKIGQGCKQMMRIYVKRMIWGKMNPRYEQQHEYTSTRLPKRQSLSKYDEIWVYKHRKAFKWKITCWAQLRNPSRYFVPGHDCFLGNAFLLSWELRLASRAESIFSWFFAIVEDRKESDKYLFQGRMYSESKMWGRVQAWNHPHMLL